MGPPRIVQCRDASRGRLLTDHKPNGLSSAAASGVAGVPNGSAASAAGAAGVSGVAGVPNGSAAGGVAGAGTAGATGVGSAGGTNGASPVSLAGMDALGNGEDGITAGALLAAASLLG